MSGAVALRAFRLRAGVAAAVFIDARCVVVPVVTGVLGRSGRGRVVTVHEQETESMDGTLQEYIILSRPQTTPPA